MEAPCVDWFRPIWARPHLYIGPLDAQALGRLVREYLCPSVDGAMSGCCQHIQIIRQVDGSIVIEDDGPGLSVAPASPHVSIPLLQFLMTSLFACRELRGHQRAAEFCQAGIAVANALSTWCEVTSQVQGQSWLQRYEAGNPGPLILQGPTSCQGLRFHFMPGHWFQCRKLLDEDLAVLVAEIQARAAHVKIHSS